MRYPVLTLLILLSVQVGAQGFLKVHGTTIRNAQNQEVLLRGMGLGGWMLQEPYMLRLTGIAPAQYNIREKITGLIGEANARKFYTAWLDNLCTKADIDSLAAWGYNSVRLPMHYNLYTLPVREEHKAVHQTWLSKGFALTDSLLNWCSAAHIYLILDLHAAPGGQGNDNAIADRDTSYPSLWQSAANREKTIALWSKLATRYAREPWIGGYDILNEPNTGFQKGADIHGCNETSNIPLKELYRQITTAIRKVDKNHIIFIEGNCWANNYDGIFPLWDNNMVISFHKYWNYNTQGSIQKFLDLRAQYQVPLWMGETGENSNAWFTSIISLLEKNDIGWTMWPLKKAGLNNPLQVDLNPGFLHIIEYWKGTGEKPSPSEAFTALMKLAEATRASNNIVHRDVNDAIFRQVRSEKTLPFKENKIGIDSILFAVDYDLGRSGVAYHDVDSAEYWVSTSTRTPWNSGERYRNDGVDIEQCTDAVTNGYNIGWIETGEWMQYTILVESEGLYDVALRTSAKAEGAKVALLVNDEPITSAAMIPGTHTSQNWETVTIKNIRLTKGWNRLRVYAAAGGFNLNYLQFLPSANTAITN